MVWPITGTNLMSRKWASQRDQRGWQRTQADCWHTTGCKQKLFGRTEFLPRTTQSESRLETRKPSTRAKWRSASSVVEIRNQRHDRPEPSSTKPGCHFCQLLDQQALDIFTSV